MRPLVSIVIPTYNTAEYISFTLDSVERQSFKEYEILVVDDGSTDNTRDVLEPYRDKIVYIYQKNRGRSEARNTGIRSANGKYVSFLDSDDLWTDYKLEQQVDLMEKNPDIDLLFGDKQRFDNDGRILIHSMFREKGYDHLFFGGPLFVSEPYRKLLDEPYIPTGTVMIRKACLQQTGLFDPDIYAEDWEFWLRAALFCRFAYADEIWELERDRPGSGSKNLEAVYESNIQALEKHKLQYADILTRLDLDLDKRLAILYKNYGYFLLLTQRRSARRHLANSLSIEWDIRTLSYWGLSHLPTEMIRWVQGTRHHEPDQRAH